MSVSSTLDSISSLVQNILGLCIVAVLCVVGWLGFEQWNQGERLGEFREKLRQSKQELVAERQRTSLLQDQVEKLDTALHLIKVDHRIAEIRVLRQARDPATDAIWSEIEFVEISDDGRPIEAPKRFSLKGDKVYVDYWVVKFADEYVERSEINRATSICLFRGIHGEYQSPAEAYRLDTVGKRPAAYARGPEMSHFEAEIWTDFWEFANNPQLAREKGIRAAHGEEPYMAVREGMTYRLDLRASAGLSIAPVADTSRQHAQVLHTEEPLLEEPRLFQAPKAISNRGFTSRRVPEGKRSNLRRQ